MEEEREDSKKDYGRRLNFAQKVDRYLSLVGKGQSPKQAIAEMGISERTYERIVKEARSRLYNKDNMEEHIIQIRATQFDNLKRAIYAYSKSPDDKKPSAVKAINDTIRMIESTESKLGLLPQEIKNIKIEGTTDVDKLNKILDEIANDK